ncbi:MAG: domain containing protein [Flavipsychrobacter sp.]|nr:domain containing protein [Flavipsychrobacter sp.]
MQVNLKKPFLFHLAIVLGLCVLLFVLFFAALNQLTAHGKELKMPLVKGKAVGAAIKDLKALHFEVYVDSTYDPFQPPLAVLKQMPDTGTIVKPGRTVFLTVNMLAPTKIVMPNLVGLSFGSATMLLRNSKLILGDTSYKPNNAKGVVLEQNCNGATASPGKMIPQGSRISLVLGAGAGKVEHDMPDVYGQTLDIALTVLAQYNLDVTVISKSNGVIDTNTATVIDQDPKDANEEGVFNHVKRGSKVVLTVE